MRITFGRYIPKNSVIHRMDPRLKLVMIILLIVAIFFPIGYTGYIFMSAVIMGLFVLSKLNFRMLLTLLFPVCFIFTVILFLNFFLMHPESSLFAPGEKLHDWVTQTKTGWIGNIPASFKNETQAIGHFYNWKVLWFSEKAVYSALLMGWRIYLMITLTCILTGTTQPLQLTLAIEDLLLPLRLIGIPVYILSMIISIALRMIPTLIDEAGRIMKAQSSRGIDIKNGKKKDKLKGLTSLIIPLLVSAFQKAEDLAYAMDARGYEPHAKRTRYVQFEFKMVDFVLFTLGLAIAIFAIVYASMPETFSFLHMPQLDALTVY
ncbi:energy-coupling factor transporter transmembrane protein EcfT [Mesoplasma syrphidae]|uniref:Energy-coupling factor transporter transmembrane protein EcfT n=1 Tax=Mesoplasma syrphidae TaxID=225999 RepID=A0A2K9CCG4_9MOLU|nr:energy-coupling factor transporter transmembrane component T [Mesoplasma syrphidae]AUF83334.1 energy-coupling factor transporter transmembrane protein EcfT [Mesoplasma syrphidae]